MTRSGGSININWGNINKAATTAGYKFTQGIGKLGEKAGEHPEECWWNREHNYDEKKILACLAETVGRWNKVLSNAEGLKCVFEAEDDAEELLACKAKHNGAGAVTVNFFLGVSLATLLLVRAG